MSAIPLRTTFTGNSKMKRLYARLLDDLVSLDLRSSQQKSPLGRGSLMRRMLGLGACVGLGLALLTGPNSSGLAQEYPTRPIHLIVPFAAGGGADAVARVIAQRISGPLGQQVVVENRGGAAAIVGTEFVA